MNDCIRNALNKLAASKKAELILSLENEKAKLQQRISYISQLPALEAMYNSNSQIFSISANDVPDDVAGRMMKRKIESISFTKDGTPQYYDKYHNSYDDGRIGWSSRSNMGGFKNLSDAELTYILFGDKPLKGEENV